MGPHSTRHLCDSTACSSLPISPLYRLVKDTGTALIDGVCFFLVIIAGLSFSMRVLSRISKTLKSHCDVCPVFMASFIFMRGMTLRHPRCIFVVMLAVRRISLVGVACSGLFNFVFFRHGAVRPVQYARNAERSHSPGSMTAVAAFFYLFGALNSVMDIVEVELLALFERPHFRGFRHRAVGNEATCSSAGGVGHCAIGCALAHSASPVLVGMFGEII